MLNLIKNDIIIETKNIMRDVTVDKLTKIKQNTHLGTERTVGFEGRH